MAEENQRADPGEDQRLLGPAQPVPNDGFVMSLPNFEFNGSMPTGNFKVQVGPDTCHFVAGKMFYSLLGLLVVGAVAAVYSMYSVQKPRWQVGVANVLFQESERVGSWGRKSAWSTQRAYL